MNKYYFFKRILSNLVVSFMFLSLFFGCAGTGKEKNELFFDKWKAIADKSEGYSPTPSEGTDEQKGSIIEDSLKKKITSDKVAAEQPIEKPLPKQKLTLEMHDVEIAVLLKTLARSVNQNIIISESVKGAAYISIKDTPWDQVFKGVLNANGLSYEWEGDIIRIITTDDINQSLKLMKAKQDIAAGKQEYELEMEILRSRVKMAEPLQTWIYHVKYADTKTLRDNLEQFLTSSYGGGRDSSRDFGEQGMSQSGLRGAILVDTHTNSIVIQAVQSELEIMRAMVLELDKPTLQVLIQAHIVEANSSTALALGIQWGGLYRGSVDGQNWITPGANSTGITDSKLSAGIDPTSGMAVNFPANIIPGGPGLTLGFISVSILLEHLLVWVLHEGDDEGHLYKFVYHHLCDNH
ncbi:MAG: hypothetical protein JJV89_01515 [Desulfosarcina sp.]|nr:hypothetical protein [Desulfobacterales bacterium]